MSKKGSSEGSDRFEYLQTLVTEFQDTDSEGGWRRFICMVPGGVPDKISRTKA